MLNFGTDKKRAVQAKYDAQKIAFAPIMFQAALALRNLGYSATGERFKGRNHHSIRGRKVETARIRGEGFA